MPERIPQGILTRHGSRCIDSGGSVGDNTMIITTLAVLDLILYLTALNMKMRIGALKGLMMVPNLCC